MRGNGCGGLPNNSSKKRAASARFFGACCRSRIKCRKIASPLTEAAIPAKPPEKNILAATPDELAKPVLICVRAAAK